MAQWTDRAVYTNNPYHLQMKRHIRILRHKLYTRSVFRRKRLYQHLIITAMRQSHMPCVRIKPINLWRQ